MRRAASATQQGGPAVPGPGDLHERISDDSAVAAGSDRVFGIAFTLMFSVIGLLPLAFGHTPRWWALGVAAALLAVAAVWPALLRPVHKVWFRVARLLSRFIIAPVVMAVLFYGVVTPTGLIMRMLGKDSLHRRYQGGVRSYWIHREPAGPAPETMRNQF